MFVEFVDLILTFTLEKVVLNLFTFEWHFLQFIKYKKIE